MLFAENHQFRSLTAPFWTPPIQRRASEESKIWMPKKSLVERDPTSMPWWVGVAVVHGSLVADGVQGRKESGRREK
ncbi:hypothetical protein BJX96DRAFT_114686 [Aspergillus floccosus]